MSSILLLFICLLLGIVFQKLKNFPSNAHLVLNQFILNVSLPAMALYYLPTISLSWQLLFPLLVAWISFGIAYLLFSFLGKRFGWSRKLVGCLILTGGLGNTSFVGIPIIQALYGEGGLRTLVIVDLPGTFVVLSTLGIIVATIYSKGKVHPKTIAKKVLQFPPFIAFIIGLLMIILKVQFPDVLSDVFKSLAATVSPIALVSVGLQLSIQKRSRHWPFLFLGLGFQLLLFPAIIFCLYVLIFNQGGLEAKVCVLESAMAPMITSAIVASAYGLKPKLSNMMVGIGIPLSFITISLWYLFLEFYFG